jgi:hypothetical protein
MHQFGYRPQPRMPQPSQNQMMSGVSGGGVGVGSNIGQMMMQGDTGFDGKMLRKSMARKTVDYNPSIVRYLEVDH